MSSQNPKVEPFLDLLDHPLKTYIVRIRTDVLASDDRFREQIK